MTTGDYDGRTSVEDLTSHFQGVLFEDKGYVFKDLFHKLLKKGMKNILIDLKEKILLRKRSIIEMVFGYLKKR
jgi:hypothetical protein